MALVSLAMAKRHLHVDGADFDADLQDKLEQASEIVIDYIKRPDHGWTETTSPHLIKAAVCIALADLWEQRGSGLKETKIDAVLNPTVCNILHRYRDPAFA